MANLEQCLALMRAGALVQKYDEVSDARGTCRDRQSLLLGPGWGWRADRGAHDVN